MIAHGITGFLLHAKDKFFKVVYARKLNGLFAYPTNDVMMVTFRGNHVSLAAIICVNQTNKA